MHMPWGHQKSPHFEFPAHYSSGSCSFPVTTFTHATKRTKWYQKTPNAVSTPTRRDVLAARDVISKSLHAQTAMQGQALYSMWRQYGVRRGAGTGRGLCLLKQPAPLSLLPLTAPHAHAWEARRSDTAFIHVIAPFVSIRGIAGSMGLKRPHPRTNEARCARRERCEEQSIPHANSNAEKSAWQ